MMEFLNFEARVVDSAISAQLTCFCVRCRRHYEETQRRMLPHAHLRRQSWASAVSGRAVTGCVEEVVHSGPGAPGCRTCQEPT